MIDPEECPECGLETNKFVGECQHCGHNRWEGAASTENDTMTDTPDSPYKGDRPAELDDVSLYKEWQHVKEYGPKLRLDDVQAEIAERWEAIVQKECDVR